MSIAINIDGIESDLPGTVDRLIKMARRRGVKTQFILYIENKYLRIALEVSPRFDKYQASGNFIGTYTPEIEPAILAEDIMVNVNEYMEARGL